MAVSTLRPDTWYRFTLPYRPGYSLDVINDGHAHEDGKLQIAPTGNYSGQHWQLIPSASGTYRMRTMYTGPDMYLTVRGEDNLDPHLTHESGKAGRFWHIVPCSHGTVKIKLNESGQDYYLGSKDDANWFRAQRPVLSHQEDQTQVWQTEIVRLIEEPIFDAGRHMGW
jgi:immune inhibitor A